MKKQTMFIERREAGIVHQEQVDYYLAADVDARFAELERQNSEWLAANGPGGWIDDLRKKVAELEQLQMLVGAVIVKVHGERDRAYDVADLSEKRIFELEKALRDLLDIGKGIGWFPGERWKWQKAAELLGEKISL